MFDHLHFAHASCAAAVPLPTGADAGVACHPPGPAATVTAFHFKTADWQAAAYLGWAKKGGVPRGIPCGTTSSPWRGESVIPRTTWKLMCYRDSAQHEWAVLSDAKTSNLVIFQGRNADYETLIVFALVVLDVPIPGPAGTPSIPA